LKSLKTTGLSWFWVAIVILILDRVTKILALSHLEAYSPAPICEWFNFMLAYNKGAAFSFLSDASGWQTWLFGGISIAVTLIMGVWLYRLSAKQRLLSIALTLIIGGALGNLSDRIHYGFVVDFLDFHWNLLHFPTFNIADSAICIGAFLLFVDAFLSAKKK
jgi:signal peptidase II